MLYSSGSFSRISSMTDLTWEIHMYVFRLLYYLLLFLNNGSSVSTPSPLSSEQDPLLWRSPGAAVPSESLRGCLRWRWGTPAQHLDVDHTEWGSRMGGVRRYNCGNHRNPWMEGPGIQGTGRARLQTMDWKFEKWKTSSSLFNIQQDEHSTFKLPS